jgi:hypothetical protein
MDLSGREQEAMATDNVPNLIDTAALFSRALNAKIAAGEIIPAQFLEAAVRASTSSGHNVQAIPATNNSQIRIQTVL